LGLHHAASTGSTDEAPVPAPAGEAISAAPINNVAVIVRRVGNPIDIA
jgi:hypothetical protein